MRSGFEKRKSQHSGKVKVAMKSRPLATVKTPIMHTHGEGGGENPLLHITEVFKEAPGLPDSVNRFGPDIDQIALGLTYFPNLGFGVY